MRISDVDRHLKDSKAATFLKHDVHGLALEALIDFAGAQRDAGVLGSYFFMPPDHPVTKRHYSFQRQVAAMHELRGMGHELGLHLDPIELIHETKGSLRQSIHDVLARFAREGIQLPIGNTHGNTAHPMRDQNGHTSAFEFFQELGRQGDYPDLANLPVENAQLIRDHRCSVVDLGFTHWADMPMWSQRHRHIVTHFVSDNLLGKDGTLKFATLPDTNGRYKLMDQHPPRARMPGTVREFVHCGDADANLPIGSFNVALDEDECERWFGRLANQPVLLLIHPEHYC